LDSPAELALIFYALCDYYFQRQGGYLPLICQISFSQLRMLIWKILQVKLPELKANDNEKLTAKEIGYQSPTWQ